MAVFNEKIWLNLARIKLRTLKAGDFVFSSKQEQQKFNKQNVEQLEWRYEQKWISVEKRPRRWDFFSAFWSKFFPISFGFILGQKCPALRCNQQPFESEIFTSEVKAVLIVMCLKNIFKLHHDSKEQKMESLGLNQVEVWACMSCLMIWGWQLHLF